MHIKYIYLFNIVYIYIYIYTLPERAAFGVALRNLSKSPIFCVRRLPSRDLVKPNNIVLLFTPILY